MDLQRESPAPRAKVRWGILGTAKIARTKVVPAMQRGTWTEVVAIASRDRNRAERTAQALGIAKAYGSYGELLADPAVEAVYIPLPNHLHVPWSVKAAEAGKHVLCEKPLALSLAEARELLAVRDRAHVRIQEAFMVRTAPQWLRAREVARSGRIGELRAVLGFFSYFNRDPRNVRNVAAWGGGALMDVGCYPITTSRFMFDEEPRRVAALVERDPEFGTDRLTSAILEFPSGRSAFTCSTQLAPYQRMHFMGTKGRLEIEIPFNAPPDRPCRLFVDDGSDLYGGSVEAIEVPAADQYAVQADRFSEALRNGSDQPVPLEDSVRNTAAIEAVLRAGKSGRWETVGSETQEVRSEK